MRPTTQTTRIIEDWKRRLVAMADAPPYVFKDTPEHLIERHYSRLTGFDGYSEAEIASVESELGLEFPEFFRCFLLQMGKAPGEMFCGSDFAGLSKLGEFREEAAELMASTGSTLGLPSEAVVFLFHQGYAFNFFIGGSRPDTPVSVWCEGDIEPAEVCPSFEQFLEDHLRVMEEGHQQLIETGGYYLTLYPQGGKRERPARSRGRRPLDRYEGGTSIGRPPKTKRRFGPRVVRLWRRLFLFLLILVGVSGLLGPHFGGVS